MARADPHSRRHMTGARIRHGVERMRRVARTGMGMALAAATLLGTAGLPIAFAATSVSRTPVVAFQPAGNVGGGVLVPGTTYPPTTHGHATLKRGSDWVQVDIATSGLPSGAYTVWWVVFNTPNGCSGGCDAGDLFTSAANPSVFWATGEVVGHSGVTHFRDRHRVGDALGAPGTQHIIGNGALDPGRAEIHNVVKYHGPASADPGLLLAQTTTVQGGCSEGANAVDLGAPFGVQCFDPQVVAHPSP